MPTLKALRFYKVILVLLPMICASAGFCQEAGSNARVTRVQQYVRKVTRQSLRGPWKGRADAVSRAILTESARKQFDPILVLAVIEHESRFSPSARGRYGEIGLMQIKPSTARWVARTYGLPWKGRRELENPVYNIRIGTAYFSLLREEFGSRNRLYLAAYNVGAANARRARHKRASRRYTAAVISKYLQHRTKLTRLFSRQKSSRV